MATVLLVIQLILSVVLTVLVLLQRSEGGALGIGGGGGGGFMSGRSATTSIVRLTTIVGGLFILNCVALTIAFNSGTTSRLEEESAVAPRAVQQETAPGSLTTAGDSAEEDVPSAEDLLLPGGESAAPEESPETEEPRPE